MGQALYRKYRSKSLSEIVGQEHITKTLDQAVRTNRISHAYLFTGPRGVGKTSIARILAHDINGLNYTDDSSHVDIIEIDAASNRRIDEIRELREKVYIAPTMAKYKVYIIDEVHMLTKEAFNALLKTLEEPPAHVVFILATTDAHKLPETIVSRTQRFQFKPIEKEKVVSHLKQIAAKESINIDEAALNLIAQHGQGSFRDSISLLDQAANYSQSVTADTINTLLGTPPEKQLDTLIAYLSSDNSRSLVSLLNSLFDSGYPAPIIATQLSAKLREQIITNQLSITREKLLNLLVNLIDVPASPDPEHFLEISLLKALPFKNETIVRIKSTPIETIKNKEKTEEQHNSQKPSEPIQKKPKIKEHDDTEVKPKTAKNEEVIDQKLTASESLLDDNSWNDVLDLLKSKYNTLYGIVRMAKIETPETGIIKLNFAFAFHQKRINDAKNRDIILAAIKKVTGKNYHLECVIDKSLLSNSKPKPEIVKESDLSAISNIFGEGEILPE